MSIELQDVTLPNGDVVPGVPKGTPIEEVQRIYNAYNGLAPQQQQPQAQPSPPWYQSLFQGALGAAKVPVSQVQQGLNVVGQIPFLGPALNQNFPLNAVNAGVQAFNKVAPLNATQTPAEQAGSKLMKSAEYVAPALLAPEVAGGSVLLRSLVDALGTGGISLSQGDPKYEAFKKALIAGGVSGLTGGAFRGLEGLGKAIDALPPATRLGLADALEKAAMIGGLAGARKTAGALGAVGESLKYPLFLERLGRLAPGATTAAGAVSGATTPWWNQLYPSSSTNR
jgi:hypothetical protein